MADKTAETVNSEADNSPAPKDDIAALRAEMEQIRRERDTYRAESQNERSARLQAEQRGMSETEKRILAEETACSSAIESMGREADAIEAEIARLADEPGHGAEIAKLNRKMAGIEADLRTEKQRQTWLSGQREAAKAKSAETVSDTGQKLANGAALSQFAPEVQSWFKKHPQCFTDTAYLNKAIAAAGYARDVEGLAENTDDYFAFVDDRLNGKAQASSQPNPVAQDDEGEELVPTVQRPQARAAGPGSMAAVIAPPSRSAPTGTGTPGNRRQPLLSPDEREAADGLFGHIPQKDRYLHYAERKEMMKKLRPSAFGSN